MTLLDLSRLGPDPTGSNRLPQMLQLLADRKQPFELRLARQCLPVVETRMGCYSSNRVTLRVVLPPALGALKQMHSLQLLQRRASGELASNQKKIQWKVEAGVRPLGLACSRPR